MVDQFDAEGHPKKHRIALTRETKRFFRNTADAPDSVITRISFNEKELIEKTVTDLFELKQALSEFPVNWIHVRGLKNKATIEKLAMIFNMHELVVEDVMTFHQRAKVEDYGGQYFIVCHMLKLTDQGVEQNQLNIFLGKNFVVTMHDGEVDSLDSDRDRLRKGHARVRASGPDYLTYTLIDAVLDAYFPILEVLGDSLESLEDELIDRPTKEVMAKIHANKRNLIVMRRSAWPLREAINSLIRDNPPSFSSDTLIHMRDCADHTVQVLDFVETYRELAADLMDVYLSSISNRMNEVMKVLTIITTVCVPPTLIAGIYGMNFNPQASPYNMPELNWYFGYPFALLLMFFISVGTLSLMAWKGWLGTFWHKAPR